MSNITNINGLSFLLESTTPVVSTSPTQVKSDRIPKYFQYDMEDGEGNNKYPNIDRALVSKVGNLKFFSSVLVIEVPPTIKLRELMQKLYPNTEVRFKVLSNPTTRDLVVNVPVVNDSCTGTTGMCQYTTGDLQHSYIISDAREHISMILDLLNSEY